MDLDVTFIIQAIIVLTVLATLGPALLNPTLRVLELREQSITGAKAESQKLLADTAAKERELEAQLEAARRQALAERAKLIGEAKEAERALLDKARGEAMKSLEAARTKLKENEQKTRATLEQSGRDLAKTIAGKLLSRDVA